MPAGCLAELLKLYTRCPFRAAVDLCCGALVRIIGVQTHDNPRGHRPLAHRMWVGRREQDHDSHGLFDALVEARLHFAELALDPQDNRDSNVSRVVGALKPRFRLLAPHLSASRASRHVSEQSADTEFLGRVFTISCEAVVD